MKPVKQPIASFVPPPRLGRGWRVFIDELVVVTRIGIHAHGHMAAQPVVIDASLTYRCVPSEWARMRRSITSGIANA